MSNLCLTVASIALCQYYEVHFYNVLNTRKVDFSSFKQNREMVVVACCLHYHAAESYILIYTPWLFQLSSLKVIDYILLDFWKRSRYVVKFDT